MHISENEDGKVVIVSVEGRVDTESAVDVNTTLQNVVSSGKYNLVLDMSDVSYISSSGLRVLADILTRSRKAGGDLKLVGLSDKVLRVMQIIGFTQFFSMYETLEDARQAF